MSRLIEFSAESLFYIFFAIGIVVRLTLIAFWAGVIVLCGIGLYTIVPILWGHL